MSHLSVKLRALQRIAVSTLPCTFIFRFTCLHLQAVMAHQAIPSTILLQIILLFIIALFLLLSDDHDILQYKCHKILLWSVILASSVSGETHYYFNLQYEYDSISSSNPSIISLDLGTSLTPSSSNNVPQPSIGNHVIYVIISHAWEISTIRYY